MKRRYLPLNMVMNGRYAVLYGKLSPKEQQDVLSKMAELIEEEKEYEDKGNYGHLCNILPTIAIDEALQKNGKSAEEAFELISTHMWAALTPEKVRKMSRLPFFLPVMKRIIPLGFKYGSGKGWRYTWFDDDPKDRYHFECNECLYQYEFGKRNLLDIDFQRTQTLCQGGQKCDFCFVLHRKGEVWKRTESI